MIKRLPRRTFLRGLGVAMALPALESMTPAIRAAAETGLSNSKYPRRMAFVYIPNGANMADWTPATEGADFTLPAILDPLKAVRNDLLVLSGLAHDKARPHGDGAGDHARALATFLTGCQARKTDGADIRVGTSVDQVAAAQLGRYTRLPSLELGCDRGQQTGNCDSGYSCAYSFNLSWRTPSSPMPPEVDPRSVFERLFGNASAEETPEIRAMRVRHRRSVLDAVAEDSRQLRTGLGQTDRRKLDEYLSSVREIELRIESSEKFASALPDYDKPGAEPQTYEDQLRLMFDLLALSFQTDTTRIATFVLAHDGSNRPYPSLGVPEGHHDLSHHGNDEAKKAKIAKINRFHITQFARFVEKLKATPEGDGSLLNNAMIVYGSGIGDGNAHNHDNLPVLLAGRGGGAFSTGRHVRFPQNTPMTNLYLTMLERMGVHADSLGDSTGRLEIG